MRASVVAGPTNGTVGGGSGGSGDGNGTGRAGAGAGVSGFALPLRGMGAAKLYGSVSVGFVVVTQHTHASQAIGDRL